MRQASPLRDENVACDRQRQSALPLKAPGSYFQGSQTMTYRETLDLDGLWRFQPDPHDDGEALGFWRPETSVRLWREVPVPSVFEAAGPELDGYTGLAWYHRTFRVPVEWAGRRLSLQFAGVNYRARIWLNGQLLGEHREWLPAFRVPGRRDRALGRRQPAGGGGRQPALRRRCAGYARRLARLRRHPALGACASH